VASKVKVTDVFWWEQRKS